MSSALAMALMAAMAVPGNGPEKVSEEVEQRLDLRGEWEGVFVDRDGKEQHGKLGGAFFQTENAWVLLGTIKDEGNGKFRFSVPDCPAWFDEPGIYRQDGGRLTLCWHNPSIWHKEWGSKPRPSRFKWGDDQCLLILHRVKPGK
jgi:uncharacterized protein (TIGR03067 family)